MKRLISLQSFKKEHVEESRREYGNRLVSRFMNTVDQGIEYNTSFDLLIPIITVIGKLEPYDRVSHTYSFDINGNGTTIDITHNSHRSDFEMIRHNSRDNITYNTFSAIVEFIEWYNTKIDLQRDRTIDEILK
jgi:hypothetical protein